VVVAALGLMMGGRVTAQTFNVLHSFTGSDGANPFGSLILSGMTLYGTTQAGGSFQSGTIFAFNANGTGFTNLYDFTGGNDGAAPSGNLILSGNTLYGTAGRGGNSNNGTVFAINTDGSGFTNLHSFTGSDGVMPNCGLALSGSTLYGTAQLGGASGNGTVFAVNTDGTEFTNLHHFTSTPHPYTGTNSDGAIPTAGVVYSNSTLYGTANFGGLFGWGTIYSIKTDGTSFTNLHSFTEASGQPATDPTFGLTGLIIVDNSLFGTTKLGGAFSAGEVFKLNMDGTGFVDLHDFDQLDGLLSPPYGLINFNGGFPNALMLSGNRLYGTASGGGYWCIGTAFELHTDDTGFEVLYNFAYTVPISPVGPWNTNRDGGEPNGLILAGNTLYGTARSEGISGNGTVFSISLPLPQLTTIRSGANLLLSWPTDFSGFTLQSTTNLGSPVWTTNSPSPVVVNA
jgi:uncharacterized repeat protein (TIGR03803 family)